MGRILGRAGLLSLDDVTFDPFEDLGETEFAFGEGLGYEGVALSGLDFHTETIHLKEGVGSDQRDSLVSIVECVIVR